MSYLTFYTVECVEIEFLFDPCRYSSILAYCKFRCGMSLQRHFLNKWSVKIVHDQIFPLRDQT